MMAVARMVPTSDGNEIRFKTSAALYDYLLSKGEVKLYLKSESSSEESEPEPELFYLKNKLTGQYLYRRDKESFGAQDYCEDHNGIALGYCLFTQKEIDTMQVGSYDKVKVGN